MKRVEYIGRINEEKFIDYTSHMVLDGRDIESLFMEFLNKRVRLVITELPDAECQYASVDGVVFEELDLVMV